MNSHALMVRSAAGSMALHSQDAPDAREFADAHEVGGAGRAHEPRPELSIGAHEPIGAEILALVRRVEVAELFIARVIRTAIAADLGHGGAFAFR